MIVTTDLHLTDRARDAYRWELFPWLLKFMEADDEPLLILGDLTHEKDGHNAALVDRIVRTLGDFAATGREVWVLKGNHDYTDPDTPFFGFLDRIPGVHFIAEPSMHSVGGSTDVLFLPHTWDPMDDWEDITDKFDVDPDLVVCHQTFNGAKASNGHVLQGGRSGISSRYFSKRHGLNVPILSGDIHVPQKCGDVVYVGTPYPVAFGDEFQPRIMIVDPDTHVLDDAYPESIRKLVLDIDPTDFESELQDAREGDQVKLRVQLGRDDLHAWGDLKEEIRAAFEKHGVRVHSIELSSREAAATGVSVDEAAFGRRLGPSELLTAFCDARGLSDGERWAAEGVLIAMGLEP